MFSISITWSILHGFSPGEFHFTAWLCGFGFGDERPVEQFADRIAPGADAHIQVRPAAGMDSNGFHRIAYEDAVDDIIDGSLVFFMTADDFPAVVVEEYVVPYSLDAGSNTFLD